MKMYPSKKTKQFGDYEFFEENDEGSLQAALNKASETLIPIILKNGVPVKFEWIVHIEKPGQWEMVTTDEFRPTVGWKCTCVDVGLEGGLTP